MPVGAPCDRGPATRCAILGQAHRRDLGLLQVRVLAACPQGERRRSKPEARSQGRSTGKRGGATDGATAGPPSVGSAPVASARAPAAARPHHEGADAPEGSRSFVHYWPFALLLALLAGAGNVLGGYLIVFRRPGQVSLLRFVALGGGFLLAAALLDMVPSALEAGRLLGPASVVLGYLLLLFLENLVTEHAHRYDRAGDVVGHAAGGAAADPATGSPLPPHTHTHRHAHHVETHPHFATASGPGIPRSTALSVLAGMLVHTFFDGVSIAAGFLAGNVTMGLLMFEAVILHNAGDGFSVSAVALAASGNRRQALGAAFAIAAATVSGALSTALLGQLATWATDALLGLAAGTFLYIALTDLVPAVNENRDRPALLYVVLGAAAFTASWLALDRAGLG
jgi:zinc transporter ZupT